jgi:hypothetical protein
MTLAIKNLTNILCFVLMFFITGLMEAQGILIPFGSTWAYYDAAMEPPSQNANTIFWQQLTFVDDASNGWGAGPAQLGYGDGDEATTISSATETAYFRHVFNVADTAGMGSLSLNLIYDDGAVIYLNGTEVWRVNMPAGLIDYNTFASAASGDNATASEMINSPMLFPGDNILAVEVHQRSAASSDISFDFSLSVNPVNEILLLRGPYLQKGSPNSIVVKWRTSDSTQSIVDYGTNVNSLSLTDSVVSVNINHEVEITGLNPNTKYYYRVRTSDDVLVPEANDLYFKTSPVHGSSQKVRAWILGDPGTANNNARSVRDAYYDYIDTAHTDMILFLGDNAYVDGTDAQYQLAVFENMYEDKLKNTVSWSTLGNHDGHSADSETQTGPYYEIFTLPTAGESGGMASGTEAYYSFDFANLHFIILDSYDSDRSIGGDMYDWCLSDLQNTTAEWIVAIWHHPAYSKGSHDSDSENQLIQMRTNFLPLLESYGADIVLSGHSHSYERSYFINGHYDISDSFNIAAHTVGTNGSGDGRVIGDGPYVKSFCQDDGAVYLTAGSSGQTSSGKPLDHEAMFISMEQLGSCVLEVDSHVIQFKFIGSNGIVEDSFSIIKVECDTSSITVCSNIASTYADVEENSLGAIYQESSDLEMVEDPASGLQVVGLVFQNLHIPRGSWIQSAHIQFMADDDAVDVSADSSYLIIRGHAVDHADLFNETLFDVSNRPTTMYSTNWQPEPWNIPSESTEKQKTPDLSRVIQEIINRPGYSQLSNIGFTINGVGKRSAASFDNGPSTIPAELCVTYATCNNFLRAVSSPDATTIFTAEQTVISDDIFNSVGLEIDFSSGIEIILEPNFEIELGREFYAFILGCKLP